MRDEELDNLDTLKLDACALPVPGGSENTYGKVNILIQAHIYRERIEAFSLVSDQAYIIQVRDRTVNFAFCLTCA